MRLYTFTNMYLSSIQNGIQSAHIVSELFSVYKHSSMMKLLMDWANNHKTIIVCNGGQQDNLEALYNKFDSICYDESHDFSLPYAKFYEEDKALNGALTAVGILLPEFIYNYSPPVDFNYTDTDKVAWSCQF